jgi:hypothetical protein
MLLAAMYSNSVSQEPPASVTPVLGKNGLQKIVLAFALARLGFIESLDLVGLSLSAFG